MGGRSSFEFENRKKRNVLRVQKYVVQLPVQLHCVDVIKNELRQQKMRR